MLTAVFNPIAQTVTTYVNGSVQNTASTGAGYTQIAETGANPLLIGYDNVNSGYFYGYINDVRIYDRALSAAEIQEIYKAER